MVETRHAPNRFRPWLLLQDRLWIDAQGQEHDPRRIEMDYVHNLRDYLDRRITESTRRRAVCSALVGTVVPDDASEWAHDDADQFAEELLDGLQQPLAEWLHATPLYRLLTERLREDAEAEAVA